MNREILENQLDKKTKSLIVEMEKKLSEKDAEINNLKNENEYLKAQLANRNRKIFSATSEKIDPNQLSLFNEAEKESNLNIDEPIIEEVCYTRKKPSKNKGKKDNLEGLEKVIIEHKLSEEEAICKECGSPLEIIGVNSTKQVLKFVPVSQVVLLLKELLATKRSNVSTDHAIAVQEYEPKVKYDWRQRTAEIIC